MIFKPFKILRRLRVALCPHRGTVPCGVTLIGGESYPVLICLRCEAALVPVKAGAALRVLREVKS